MDSAADPKVYLAVQEIIRQNAGLVSLETMKSRVAESADHSFRLDMDMDLEVGFFRLNFSFIWISNSCMFTRFVSVLLSLIFCD